MGNQVLERIARFPAYALTPFLPHGALDWFRRRVILRRVLKTLSINCVVDVGANRGQYGMLLRQIGYRGLIVSFEPVQSTRQVLEKVAAGHAPWQVLPFALGAANSVGAINVTAHSLFSSFLTPRSESQETFPGNRIARVETVEIRRLDDVLGRCLTGISTPRIYLKIDTQGFDLEVVRGAESVLSGILALQTEVSLRSLYHDMPDFTESLQTLRDHGFDVVDFLPVSAEFAGLLPTEMDCIMIHRERATSAGLPAFRARSAT